MKITTQVALFALLGVAAAADALADLLRGHSFMTRAYSLRLGRWVIGGILLLLALSWFTGTDFLLEFIAERVNIAGGSFEPPPTVSLAGKQVMRVGEFAGTFLYSSGDVFYYLECPDEPTAVDMLEQLP